MIRGLVCLAIILAASVIGAPILASTQHVPSSSRSRLALPAQSDPLNATGSAYAFNFTYSTADIYTLSNATVSPSANTTGTFNYFSTVQRTSSGSQVAGTAFNYTLPSSPSANRQTVNWTLTIPKSNCPGCSLVARFTMYGNLTRGTSENFTLTSTNNNTAVFPIARGQFLGNHTAPVYVCGLTASTVAGLCAGTVSIPVDNWVGFKLRLSIRFGWNSTGEAIKTSVGEVVVASIDNSVKNACTNCNFMTQTSPTTITHYARFSSIGYNATVQYHNQTSSTTISHVWTNEVINIYYPSGYNLTRIAINSTSSAPTVLLPAGTSKAPFEKESCNNGPCSQSLIAVNMSDITPLASAFARGSTLYINATSPNSLTHLNTEASGVATNFFSPGEALGVNATNSPSVENLTTTAMTGTLQITVTSPVGTLLSGTPSIVSTATGGISNFPLPQTCGTSPTVCGMWSINATFYSSFDLGHLAGSFRLDQLQVSSFSSSGSNAGLSSQGTLAYANTTTIPAGVAGLAFAVDTGTAANLPLLPTTNSSNGPGLYVRNVTFVNGVFTQGQSLVMIFTISNPSSQAVNATLMIEHEWPGSPSQRHGALVNFTIGKPNDGLGDLPFALGDQTYQASVTFTTTGVQVALSTAKSPSNAVTRVMSPGTSPVPSTAQNGGLFKITVVTTSGSSLFGSPNSLESPPYAYVYGASVLGISLAPSRYLAYSKPFITDGTGSFSASMNSTAILGAKKLVLFVLGRDASGLVIENSANSLGFTDSTVLLPSMDSIGQVAESQTVTATLHLTNNSTKTTATITVNLNLQGSSGPVASQAAVTIPPGQTQSVALTFKAPSTPGQYALTFSSPQYQNGTPLSGQTLQVIILQSNLQILIPAAIGIVFAIIVLVVYMIWKSPEKGDEEVTKKASGPKPKPTGTKNPPPSKSLTRTEELGR